MPTLASQPARPVYFACSSSSGGGGGARWSSPTHYQVGRSIVGRRRARAQRAHRSFDGRSRARRARLAAMRGSVALRVRDHVARSRSRSPPFASRLARLDRRHLAAGAVLRYTFISLRKAPLRLVRTFEAGDSQPDGAPLGGTLHPSSLRTKSGDRRDETNKRRCGGGGRVAAAVV